ncbi:AB hydrolase-1 domain-containing protein [Mycena indigotica]|uniref:AB hydrolase-1 domain-containing protein n=1 Tax=Mycena indigotica TaxID=2126181 RepID=A0A8H6SKI1_9AGAR|nr:AB hydrolase-1 domain-containing protein [Mycena indigotica]KAF7301071.1 AB hydrolase-1 domain-containing protein [Mycena indigotica]
MNLKGFIASLVWLRVAATAYASPHFVWNQITPSEDLVWTKCYGDRECGRLKVPMDYSKPDHGFASIALIRVRSKVPHDSPHYRGPVLINPGGPGGSGVDTVRRNGDLLSLILGPEFDVVGFDPRGIARSTPSVSFFASQEERALLFSEVGYDSLNATSASLARAWSYGSLVGQLAGERNQNGTLQFMTTDHTARDMLRIVEAHGRKKLQYWGFSYGSVLGSTFAAMFPDRVERLVIDGVADVENYFEVDWSVFLTDADAAWQSFAANCVAAGPSSCAFYAPTATELLSNVDVIYQQLRVRPIPVRGLNRYGIVTFSMLRTVIFQALYSPYALFRPLANALAGLAKGDGSLLFELASKSMPKPFGCSCDSEIERENSQEGLWAVLCNDGKRISPDYNDMERHYRDMLTVSQFADQWEVLRTGCLAWPEYPKNHFQGPFVANTSFPLLIVGNTLGGFIDKSVPRLKLLLVDPVTPLWAAKKMSKGFSGSVVLTQNFVGHCSVSAPSLCTQKHIRAYFRDGKLPELDTACDINAEMFPATHSGATTSSQSPFSVGALSAKDEELLGALNELALDPRNGLVKFPL